MPDASTKASRARRQLERALSGYDAIVTNAAGCGSHLKDHGVANVVDVSELLADAGSAKRSRSRSASRSRTRAT